MAVAASLNGGNCLAAFVKMVQEWVVDLGLSINQSKIWEKTIKLGQSVPYDDKLMTIQPTLFGERHNPELKGSICEIMTNNLTIGQVYIFLAYIKNTPSYFRFCVPQNASKFPIFFIYVFHFSFHANLYFYIMNAVYYVSCRHRPGHSLGKNKK